MSREKPHNTQTSRASFKDFQIQIEDLKSKRDELNKKTKSFINELLEVETEISNSLKIAKENHKKRRDYWNKKVKLLKAKKIEYKDLLDTLFEEKKKNQKQDKKENKQVLSLKQIERKIDNLERIIETEKLDMTEENEIIDQIREYAAMKNEVESQDRNNELFKIERKIEIVKINLNKIYEQLNKWSDKSQENHSKMLEMFQKADDLKEKKKRLEEELIENKKTADRYHEQYITSMNQRRKEFKGKGQYKTNKKPFKNFKHKTRKNEMLEKLREDKLAVAIEKQKSGQKLNLFEARLILERAKD